MIWCCRSPTTASASTPRPIRAPPAWASASSPRWPRNSRPTWSAIPTTPARACWCNSRERWRPRRSRRMRQRVSLVLRRYNFDLYQHRRVNQIANDERGRWAYLAHHFQENGAIRGNVISIDNITGDLNHVGQRHSGLIEQDLDLRPGLPRLDFEVSGHVALTGDVECGTGNLNQDRLTEVCEAPGPLRIDVSYSHCPLLFAQKRAPAGHVWLIASQQTNELPRVGSVDKSRHS